MLISPVLFIVMQGAAVPREGKRRCFHIFYPDLLRQPVSRRWSGSVWPKPPDESIRVAAFFVSCRSVGGRRPCRTIQDLSSPMYHRR